MCHRVRLPAISIVFLLLVPAVFAQKKAPSALHENLGALHHTIHTSNPETQRLFDQGLTFVYAFNHDEAIRRFQRAAALDPKAAMPLWGIALALGPNINLDVDPAREKQAFEAEQRALALAESAPENERAYIDALRRRYSTDPNADLKQLALNYANAMRELSRRYPDDLDAATLFAESLMDLHPWRFWTIDGEPGENTREIMTVLEGVLRRDPSHLGANHYYIHTLEASPDPEVALPSAERLETLVPSAGHLVHMPAHIYERTGDYQRAALANERAAAADRAFFGSDAPPRNNYGMIYYDHNLAFLAMACMMEGRLACARSAAARLDAHARPGLETMPMFEAYLVWPTFVEMRFAEWKAVEQLPPPDKKLVLSTYLWLFERGTAYASTGGLDRAREERAAMHSLRPQVPPGPAFGMLFNDTQVFLDLADDSLDARMAFAAGDHEAAIAWWRKAVALQDAMNYDEPEEWYYPVRESLGAVLLRDGRAGEAEVIFREDLDRHPRNPRALYGLWQSLTAQKKSPGAELVHSEFQSAWKQADVELNLADF